MSAPNPDPAAPDPAAPDAVPDPVQLAALRTALCTSTAGPVSRLSEVVPRVMVGELVSMLRGHREAQPAGTAERALMTRVCDDVAARAFPMTPAPSCSVLVTLPAVDGLNGLAELLRMAFNTADHEVEGTGLEEPSIPPLAELAADDVDRLVLEAAARHLHALITTGVLADHGTSTGTGPTDSDSISEPEGMRS